MAKYIERKTAIMVMKQMDDIVLVVEVMYDIPAEDMEPIISARGHKLREIKLSKTVECTHYNESFYFKKKRSD